MKDEKRLDLHHCIMHGSWTGGALCQKLKCPLTWHTFTQKILGQAPKTLCTPFFQILEAPLCMDHCSVAYETPLETCEMYFL